MASKKLNIFLCERIPSENRGEAAILEGMVEGLNKYIKDYELAIYSMRLDHDKEYYGKIGRVIGYNYTNAESVSIQHKIQRFVLSAKLFLSAVLKRILRLNMSFSDVLFSGFQDADIILQGHDNVYRHNIKLKDALIAFYARQHKKKLIIPAASIGPFKSLSRLKKMMSLYVLNSADLITLRDKYSGEFIVNLGIQNNYHVLTDLAFLLDPTPVPIPWRTDKKTIGFTPTKYVFQTARRKDGTAIPAVEFIREITCYLDWLSLTFDSQVILIPHAYGPGSKQDDLSLISQIYNQRYSDDAHIIALNERQYTAGELKSLIGQLDLLIACRTHSMIAALGMSTPTLTFTEKTRYKTNGILGELYNLPECLYDVQRWDSSELKERTTTIVRELDDLGKRIADRTPQVVALARKNIELIQSIL